MIINQSIYWKKNNKGIKQSKLSNVNQSIKKKKMYAKTRKQQTTKSWNQAEKQKLIYTNVVHLKKKWITKCYLHVEQYTTNISLQCFYKIVSKN